MADEKLREQEWDAAFVDAYAKALEDALEHPEKYNDIFEGYENSLPKALALIEWQKQEIEYLEEKNSILEEVYKQSEGEWKEDVIAFCNVCSSCRAMVDRSAIKCNSGKLHYCPNCGAKMKGGAE